MNAVGTHKPSPPPPNVPFGTHPRRTAWPLWLLAALYVLCFAALIWLTVRYPAG